MSPTSSHRADGMSSKYDVLVIGGGNAGHTRNMRCAHDAATEILTGPYTEEEFWEDLLRVTGGQTDEVLARHMIKESKDILNWIVKQGVRWQPSLGGTLSLGRTNSFFL